MPEGELMNDWSSGLFSCFQDCTTCIITWLVPCYTAGKNAEAVGESCLLFCLAQLINPVDIIARAFIRKKVRESKGIRGTMVSDLIWHWFCGPCALCQEARVLKDDLDPVKSMACE